MTDTKTDVLFHAELSEREFGSALLSVGKLTAWAQDKNLELMTLPPLAGYRFVQAEALLCAIERGANNLTPEQAAAIVQADPVLSKHRAATDPVTCRWLLGADAHSSWRRLLEAAIEKQELTLLNFGSKLPINDAPATQAATPPAPVVEVPASETPEQRRARWLEWYGKGERGAVQRVYKRELLLNPKADRATIGKQIKKAKTEQVEKKRGGGWASQLVQDGKR